MEGSYEKISALCFLLSLALLLIACGQTQQAGGSSTAPGISRSEALALPEPELPTPAITAVFKLGPDGTQQEMASGDKIGSWILTDLAVSNDGSSVEAVFTAHIELECNVTLDPMAGDRAYIFWVNDSYLNTMPIYANDTRSSVRFRIADGEGLEALSELKEDESLSCRVQVYEYQYNYVPMAVYSGAGINEIEILQ